MVTSTTPVREPLPGPTWPPIKTPASCDEASDIIGCTTANAASAKSYNTIKTCCRHDNQRTSGPHFIMSVNRVDKYLSCFYELLKSVKVGDLNSEPHFMAQMDLLGCWRHKQNVFSLQTLTGLINTEAQHKLVHVGLVGRRPQVRPPSSVRIETKKRTRRNERKRSDSTASTVVKQTNILIYWVLHPQRNRD